MAFVISAIRYHLVLLIYLLPPFQIVQKHLVDTVSVTEGNETLMPETANDFIDDLVAPVGNPNDVSTQTYNIVVSKNLLTHCFAATYILCRCVY